MPILTPAQSREVLYKIVFPRDGKKCFQCGRKPVGKGGVKNPRREVERVTLNHINGKRHYNPMDGSNWNGLCDSCQNTFPNRRKFKRRPHKFLRYKDITGSSRVREANLRGKLEFERPPSPEMLKRRRSELLMREYLRNYFKRKQTTYSVQAILGSIANKFFERYEDSVKPATLRDILCEVLCNEIDGEYGIIIVNETQILEKRNSRHVNAYL